MSAFEYRVVLAPRAAKKVKGVKTIGDRFAHGLTALLNAESSEGWEYVGNESFAIEGKTGLLGKSREAQETFLIFRRAKDSVAGVPLEKRLESLVEKRARTKASEEAAPPAPPSMPEPPQSNSMFTPLSAAQAQEPSELPPNFGPATRD